MHPRPFMSGTLIEEKIFLRAITVKDGQELRFSNRGNRAYVFDPRTRRIVAWTHFTIRKSAEEIIQSGNQEPRK
jgi:hypothetical protein